MEHIERGELVLYISQANATKTEKRYSLPNPVVAVYGVFDENNVPIGKKSRVPRHIFETESISLLPDKIIIGNANHARACITGYRGIHDSNIVELIIGKEAILSYLDSRTDLGLHKEWISKLEGPYVDNFPKVKSINFI